MPRPISPFLAYRSIDAMNSFTQEFQQRFSALPSHYRVLAYCCLGVFIASQALEFGVSLGRALFHLTH